MDGSVSDWVTAASTAGLAVVAWIQLPLIARQVKGLSEQIQLSREADENAERRTREWETLKACERYDFDPVIEAATLRIWQASDRGTNYFKPEVDKRDIVCLLNYLDGLGIGMAQGLYIEEVVKDHLGPIFQYAIEKFVHGKIVDGSDIDRALEYYGKWYRPSQQPNYRSGHGPQHL